MAESHAPAERASKVRGEAAHSGAVRAPVPLASVAEVRAMHERPRPRGGLPVLSAREIRGLRFRFVLKNRERPIWSAAYWSKRHGGADVVAALDYADRFTRFHVRGEPAALSVAERQLELFRGAGL